METIILPLQNVSLVFTGEDPKSREAKDYVLGDLAPDGKKLSHIIAAVPVSLLETWVSEGINKFGEFEAGEEFERLWSQDDEPSETVRMIMRIADQGHANDLLEVSVSDQTEPRQHPNDEDSELDTAINGTVRVNFHYVVNPTTREITLAYIRKHLLMHYADVLREFPMLRIYFGDTDFRRDSCVDGVLGEWLSYADYTLENEDTEYSWRAAWYNYAGELFTKYRCPDCGWEYTSIGVIAKGEGVYPYRCRKCGSLNTERQLPNMEYLKADMAYSVVD